MAPLAGDLKCLLPDSSFLPPGLRVAESGSFGTAWANPGNILSDDTTNATMAYSGSGNAANLFTEFLEGTFPSLGLTSRRNDQWN